MKGSIKSVRNFMVLIALSLLAINTQAQTTTLANFSGNAFMVSMENEMKANLSAPERGGTVISTYQEGAAIIQLDGKFGLVNKQGYEICHPVYDEIHLYNHGYAAVKKNNKWTFVNKQGQKLTPLRYDWVGGFENGLVAVLSDGKWGILNEQGFEVVPTEYEAVKIDQEGGIWVKKNKTWKKFGGEKNYNVALA